MSRQDKRALSAAAILTVFLVLVFLLGCAPVKPVWPYGDPAPARSCVDGCVA